MPLDQYQPCLCGSGKKFKFCCSNDLLAELGRVVHMLEGDQRAAALEQVTHLIEAKGKRASLMTLKTRIQMMMEDMDGAAETAAEFLEIAPQSPVARALAATAAALRGDTATAVERAQRAIELCADSQKVPHEIYLAIGEIARLMLLEADFLGARGNLLLQLRMTGPERSAAAEQLARIDVSPRLVPHLKLNFDLKECPASVVWREDFQKAVAHANAGRWWKACEAFETLASRFANQPSILYNLAVIRSWLGNASVTHAAWKAYASLPGIPLDEAVDAMVLAFLANEREDRTNIDIVTVTHAVKDVDRLMERCLSLKNVHRSEVEFSQWDTEANGPPPKALFLVDDRPPLEKNEQATRADLSRIVGELLIFGRQTDREPRCCFSLHRDGNYAANLALLREAAGEWIDTASTEEVTDSDSVFEVVFTPRLRVPDWASSEQVRAWFDEEMRDRLLNLWPQTPEPTLDGKRPVDLATDPASRIRLLAAIRYVEARLELAGMPCDANDLRQKLGLPTCDPIDPSGVDLRELPVTQYYRVDVAKLTNEQLPEFMHRAMYYGSRNLPRKLARVLVARPELEKTQLGIDCHLILAEDASPGDEALDHLKTARSIADALKAPHSNIMLTEMNIRLMRGEVNEFRHIMQHLQQHHANEPGVQEALMDIMQRYGVMLPDGRVALRLPRGRKADGAADGGAAAAPASKIWTPDSGAPVAGGPLAPPPTEGKSKLWIPD